MKSILCLLATIALLTSGLHAQADLSVKLDVTQPAIESYTIDMQPTEIGSVKRDTDIQSDGKTIEVGYHVQLTPQMNGAQPSIKIYIKSIIVDPAGTSPAPGFTTRSSSVTLSAAKNSLSKAGNTYVGTITMFDKDPVSLKLTITPKG